METLNSALDYLFEHLLSPVWYCFDFAFAHSSLPVLCVVLGLGFCLPQVYGLKAPQSFGATARKFPRSLFLGRLLMLWATLWFLYYVRLESLADFAAAKRYMLLGFLTLGIGTCIFVRDFLAVRGVAVLFLLLAKLMVDTGRPHLGQSHLVLVVQAWAYILVLAGIWLTISPWRLRDFIGWMTANERRIRVGCALRLVFGLFVAALGFTVFRG
jgi:hypothetical protein